MRGLDGRTYIVTGAASGIGRATAARLLDEGANVMGADVTDEVGTPSTGDGGRWDFARTDVTDEAAVEALVRARGRARAVRSTAWSTRRGSPAAGPSTCCPPASGTGCSRSTSPARS